MDSVLQTGTAAVLAGYLVAFVKMAAPDVKPWLLVVCAVVSGIVASILVSLSNGEIATSQSVANWVIRGFLSAAVAAGLTRTDGRAEAMRRESLNG